MSARPLCLCQLDSGVIPRLALEKEIQFRRTAVHCELRRILGFLQDENPLKLSTMQHNSCRTEKTSETALTYRNNLRIDRATRRRSHGHQP